MAEKARNGREKNRPNGLVYDIVHSFCGSVSTEFLFFSVASMDLSKKSTDAKEARELGKSNSSLKINLSRKLFLAPLSEKAIEATS